MWMGFKIQLLSIQLFSYVYFQFPRYRYSEALSYLISYAIFSTTVQFQMKMRWKDEKGLSKKPNASITMIITVIITRSDNNTIAIVFATYVNYHKTVPVCMKCIHSICIYIVYVQCTYTQYMSRAAWPVFCTVRFAACCSIMFD